MPIVGLGSWITFNVGKDTEARESCAEVMRAFFAAGGAPHGFVTDVRFLTRCDRTRPCETRSPEWIRSLRIKCGFRRPLQVAAKSRGPFGSGVSLRFDLLQVHNLLSWEAHLHTLHAMKAAGEVRYAGITTSEGRRHSEFERIMRQHPLDFIQVTYNVLDREVEARILPLARDRGIAVIANRPFQEGALLKRLAKHPLPAWAKEIGCKSWAQFVLKFIGSHAAVTCAIPATTRVNHVQENMDAAYGRLPGGDHARANGPLRREPLDAQLVDLLALGFSAVSPRTFYRLLELYNLAIWPTQLAALARGATILGMLRTRAAWQGRIIVAVLALLWLWVAWPYFLERYETINWAASYFAAGFAAETALLVWVGGFRQVSFRLSQAASRAGLAISALAMFLYPLIAPALGRPWTQAGDLRHYA